VKKACILAVAGLLLLWLAGCRQPTQHLRLATTTSTADSGLLDVIIPPFEKANRATVDILAVGTGQAIDAGRRGDADVLMVHDRAKEDKFMAEGYGSVRKDVMYNDFVIIGPPADPAGIKGLKSAAEAFAKIARSRATFISRGDESGTHGKEKALWARVGITPDIRGGWYLSIGEGMGETLTMANDKRAYTLSDRATYLSRKDKLEVVILVEGDLLLFNPYGVIIVNPDKHPNVNYELARKFVDYLTSYQTQKLISQFGVDRFGQPLFFPYSEEWRAREG